MRRLAPVIAVVVSLLAAGCGGSSSSSSAATGSAGTPGSGGSSSTATASSSTTGTVAGASSGTASSTTTTTSTQTKDTGVRLPARFTIEAGGILLPGVVAAPRQTAVALTVTAADRRAHTVVLALPHRRTIRVPAGRAAHRLLTGLKNGTYSVAVDGRVRGRLIVGAIPGP